MRIPTDKSTIAGYPSVDCRAYSVDSVLLIRQGRDQVHGLCWWKNTNRTKNFIYSSLTLGTWDKMKLMLCALFNFHMGGKIRRLSMNVAFKHIWLKRVELLNLGRIVYLYIMYRTLHDYDYHFPKIGCALFSLFG